jgi:excisionase family DNA binding protein
MSSDIRPLVVGPDAAATLLSTSKATVYQLLAAGELRSYKDGKFRKIIVKSIEEYIRKKSLTSK